MSFFGYSLFSILIFFLIGIMGILLIISKFLRKVEQGKVLVRNSMRGTKTSFSALLVIPVLHRVELLDISVKRITIDRSGKDGLICRDNMRADIKVAFFIRVNKTEQDVLKVAQSIGCQRASHQDALQELFEAKFSEALKTVGKQFDFVDLYNSREEFKDEILKIIGTELNGFIMDDAAIDYLEQTPLGMLDSDNILDAEGIKKIVKITSREQISSNQIERERDKMITKQDVEAKEVTLILRAKEADAVSRQKMEVDTLQARNQAETKKVQEEERLKAQRAALNTDEELQVAEENKDRQIVVARMNKERTTAIETERVEKDRLIEVTERQRIVSIKQIERDKAIEIEKKNIQNVIRERVMVEKTVVEEQERIKDTEAFAVVEREKRVAVTNAEKAAEEILVLDVKGAEASRQVAELKAQEKIIMAEAAQNAADKESEAKKLMAQALTAEKAAPGLAQVQVDRENNMLIETKGKAEAYVMELKATAEASGIENKAKAMKLFDAVGREHEEFKLRLNNKLEIEIAEMNNRKEIAGHQAHVLGQALKSAKVDIVGGETKFFDQIINAVTGGKVVDRYIEHSKALSDVKNTFFNADPNFFRSQLKTFFKQFNIKPEDVKHLTLSATLVKLLTMADQEDVRSSLIELMAGAERSGLGNQPIAALKKQNG